VDILHFSDGTTEAVHMYNMPPTEKITCTIQREAFGGLILDLNFDVVSYGMQYTPHINRSCVTLNWTDAWVEPEYGGIPFTVFNHKGETFIQTAETADLAGNCGDNETILYSRIASALGGVSFSEVDDRSVYCWFFTYLPDGYESRIHTVDKYDVVLLAAFNKAYNSWVNRRSVSKFASHGGFETPACIVAGSKEEALSLKKRPRTRRMPGFVVVDYIGRRASIPHTSAKDYVDKVLRMRGEVIPNQLAELVLYEDTERFIREHPIYDICIRLIRGVLQRIIEEADDNWISLSGKYDSRAKFAAVARCIPHNNILFGVWTGKVTSYEEAVVMIKPKKLIVEVMFRESKRFTIAFAKLQKFLKVQEEQSQHARKDQSVNVQKSQIAG